MFEKKMSRKNPRNFLIVRNQGTSDEDRLIRRLDDWLVHWLKGGALLVGVVFCCDTVLLKYVCVLSTGSFLCLPLASDGVCLSPCVTLCYFRLLESVSLRLRCVWPNCFACRVHVSTTLIDFCFGAHRAPLRYGKVAARYENISHQLETQTHHVIL